MYYNPNIWSGDDSSSSVTGSWGKSCTITLRFCWGLEWWALFINHWEVRGKDSNLFKVEGAIAGGMGG